MTIQYDKAPNGFDRATVTFPDGTQREYRGWSQAEVQRKAERAEAEWQDRADQPHYYDRSLLQRFFAPDPPTPWHGRTAWEKTESFLRWFW